MDVYEFFSKLQKFNVTECPDIAHDLCTILFQHEEEFCWPVLNTSNFTISNGVPAFLEKSVLVAFSGGIKSLATVFFYKNLDYDVKLVYFRESGKSATVVKQLANKLNLPLIILPEIRPRKCLKYITMATKCLEFAIDESLSADIAFGCFYNTSISSNSWSYGNESLEMWTAYEKIISNAIGEEFTIKRPLPTSSNMWDILLCHPSYLDIVDTYQPYLQIVRADHNQIELPKAKYMRNLGCVRKQYIDNTGIVPKDSQDLWKRCFFYNMRQSKYYESLL